MEPFCPRAEFTSASGLRRLFCVGMSLEDLDPEYAAFAAVLARPDPPPAQNAASGAQWEPRSGSLMAYARSQLALQKVKAKCDSLAVQMGTLQARSPMWDTLWRERTTAAQ